MRVRPSVPAACAAVALLAAAAAPALAAEEAVPAAGAATSAVTLLSVSAAGHDLAAGGVKLVTDTVSGTPVARIVVTPLTADGTPHGQQTVEAGTSRTVDAVSSSAVLPALAGIAELTGPALEVGAEVVDGAPTATAGASSLGGLEVLGLPVAVDGLLTTGSAVSSTAAQSTKTFEVTGVALPSVADLLAALGLDLSKLPLEVLHELVAELELVTPAVTAANKALDDAQALLGSQVTAATAKVDEALKAVEAAQADLAAATSALAPLEAALLEKNAVVTAAEGTVTSAQKAVDDAVAQQAAAQKAVDDATALLPKNPLTGAVLGAVDPLLTAALAEATALVTTTTSALDAAKVSLFNARSAAALAQAAVDTAKSAVEVAKGALAAANALLDAAQKALAALTADLAPQVAALLAALTAVLDDTPLVSLDKVALSTESVVTSARPGGQRAGVEGGQVQGLQVLGTDVLDDVLGSSSLELTALSGDTLAKVTAAVEGLTGTLSEVLSTVPGLPTLKVPAPQVELLSSDAATAVDGAFGAATTSVTGLKVTLPAITLPAEVALPGALQLPGVSVLPEAALPTGVSALAVGDLLTSTATTIGFGTLTEAARFRPGVAAAGAPTTGTPTTGSPTTGAPSTGSPTTAAPSTTPVSLPRTGGSGALAVLALVLVGGAVVLRRRELVEG